MESSLHGFSVEFLEAFHRTVGHHDDGVHYLFFILAQEFQGEEEKQAEMGKNIRVFAFHQLNVIFSQLERSFLEIHITRAARNHKAEIDMDDVALRVH